MTLSHLDRLEAESIHILREVAAEAKKPVLLYSVGKDSSVMLHLARKAFAPATLPFPLLHIATGWDFRAMLEHRDRTAAELGLGLIVHHNGDAAETGTNPFDTPTPVYTQAMLTDALRTALDDGAYDAVIGGGRRDEEKSRAKERIVSVRSAHHRWNPRSQRPELWNLYNLRVGAGESVRIFPLSNWTEIDVWQYIERERIPVVPLYFAASRPTVVRDATLLMVDDDRFPLRDGEVVQQRTVRFRTMGCYPLTGASESNARNPGEVIAELLNARTSEREGRVIDRDADASMERKKQEGYF